MKFKRITDWAEKSDCGRYTVSAARVMGVYRFTAWRLALNGPGVLLGATDTAQECRDLCVVDAEKRAVAPKEAA